MPRRDLLLIFAISLTGVLGGYFSHFGMLSSALLVALESYLLLLFFIAALLLKSFKRAFAVVYSAFITVLLLSFFHLLLFPEYDSIAHISYFVVLLFSYLLNLYLIYDYSHDKPLFRLYETKKPVIASAVISVMLISLLIGSQEGLYYFGILSLIGSALAYLLLIFLFSPMIRLEKFLKKIEVPTEEELRTRKLIEKYGKNREVYPFYATWLGTAVSRIEDFIDSLEAKGYLGHNFFAIQNPFYWFSVVISFAIGVDSANGSFLSVFPILLLFASGIALLGPQMFLDRRTRRMLGFLFLFAGLLVVYMKSYLVFKIAGMLAILALISIYFAYKDDELVSIIFASFFVGGLFLMGYAFFKPPVVRTPEPWLITFAVFVLLVYDLYVRGQSY